MFDRTVSYEAGEARWSEAVERPKKLYAIVLALSVQTLFFYKEGNVSDGGLALLTPETLYFSDVTNEGTEDRQTYILYQEHRFRIMGSGYTSGWRSLIGNANFQCYHALRDVN